MEKALPKAARQKVISMRPGGALYDAVTQHLSDLSEKAWAPMRNLLKSFGTTPLWDTRAALDTSIDEAYSNDPARAANVKKVFDKFFVSAKNIEVQGEPVRGAGDYRGLNPQLRAAMEQASGRPGQELTAQRLSDVSSAIGQKLPKGVLRGTQPLSGDELALSDARSIMADRLEALAPANMKGNVTQAKSGWKSYKAHQQLLYDYFDLKAAPEAKTDAGERLLQQVVGGGLSPTEDDLVKRLPPALVQKATDSLKLLHDEITNIAGQMESAQSTTKQQIADIKDRPAPVKSAPSALTTRAQEELRAIAQSRGIEQSLTAAEQASIKANLKKGLEDIGLRESAARATAQAHLDVLKKRLGSAQGTLNYAKRFVAFRLLWKLMPR